MPLTTRSEGSGGNLISKTPVNGTSANIAFDKYHLPYHFYGMTITIDKAGRVVIPAKLRRLAGLKVGTTLSASYENGAIRIERDVAGPRVESSGQRRIARPTAKDKAAIDIAVQIEEERNRWPL